MYPEIVNVPDPEVLEENPVENKHHKLTRSVRSGTMSRDLKPNASIRDQLNVSSASFSLFSAVAFFSLTKTNGFRVNISAPGVILGDTFPLPVKILSTQG